MEMRVEARFWPEASTPSPTSSVRPKQAQSQEARTLALPACDCRRGATHSPIGPNGRAWQGLPRMAKLVRQTN
jgi:hypothetical protein